MSRFKTPFILLLAVLLGCSLVSNIYLFKKGLKFHRSLSHTQLDPLGLRSHLLGPQEIDRSKGAVVVFFGDSRAAAWPPPEVRGVQFINRGINGETTSQAVGRFPQHVAPLKPQRVVIQLGINDLKLIPIFPDRKDGIVRDCKDNLRRIVEQSIASGAQVTITTIFPVAQVPWTRRPFWSGDVALAVAEVNAFIQSLKSERVAVFDSFKVLANAQGIVAPAYSLDLLHLNENGYSALNRELAGSLP